MIKSYKVPKNLKAPQPPQTLVGIMMADEVVVQIDAAAGFRRRSNFIREAVAEKLARDAKREAA